ncbi:DUF4225 domain-containing protein [Pseudomonas sp. KCJK8927]|uniref:DUF4225 domain-containing protein n=1 Tax=Pseudomonas sp. KCJK8927 TaxID=3344560 RepID=UPI0039064719
MPPSQWVWRARGNIAYYSTDLIFSGRALLRKVPRKGAWRLYRHLEADKERKIMQLSGAGLSFEFFTSGLTWRQLVEEVRK